jgi:hypothetical protein
MVYQFFKRSWKEKLKSWDFLNRYRWISIDKVYNGSIYGDFAGGNVDIISKDYKEKALSKEIGQSKYQCN